LAWIFVALGLVTLLLAGDFLVRGAVNLALRLGISALLVSLTVVAFGTSAPELLIVLSAMADGASGLAMGNVIGSNTANILLVLGLPALIAGLHTADFFPKKSFLLMILATVLFIGLAFFGPFTWWHGGILLAVLLAFYGTRDAAHSETDKRRKPQRWWPLRRTGSRAWIPQCRDGKLRCI